MERGRTPECLLQINGQTFPLAAWLAFHIPLSLAVQFQCFHDDKQGMLRGKNTMHLVEAEGRRVLHMGDLGHMPEPELIRALGRIDLLMIPVGGYYTIDAALAAAVVRSLEPDLVVPMHYRGEGFGFPVITGVEDFTERMDRVKQLYGNVLEPEWKEGPMTVVLSCPLG